MNVKPPNTHHSITALVAYQRTERNILQRISPPAPVPPANIIDSIEKRTSATHIGGYKSSARSLTKGKGIFVNVWV